MSNRMLMVAALSILPSVALAEAPCVGVFGLDGAAGPPPRSGERLEYELRFGGAYMGKLELTVGEKRDVEGHPVLPLFGRLRTTAMVSAVQAVEGRYMAMVDPSSLSPVGVKVEAKVGEDPRWEDVRFLGEGRSVETRFLYRGQEATRRFGGQHPLLEGLSLLHFARRVPLQPGMEACQDILSTRRLWRVRAKVVGRETVDTPVGPKPAHRVRTTFHRRGGRSKPIRIDILIGDMPGRPPLAFEMQQRRFSGQAKLIRWKPGRA